MTHNILDIPPGGEQSSRLDEAVAEYLMAADAGYPLEPEEWLAKYPDLRSELIALLDDLRNINCVAASLRSEAAKSGETAGDTDLIGANVRYFGDYELIRVLGRGGMGVVYLAHQISLDRPVALKMILAGHLADADDLRRFRNEAEAVARLDHPNILTIFEVGQHDGRRYFSMPLIGGGSLADSPCRFRDDPRGAAQLVAEVAEGVHHAHQRGILHRDLKPANILVDDLGRPLIGDFGLSKRLDDEDTTTGAILGTPAYMAPERASGRPVTATTAGDVYGLGAILYALVTGRPPFRADSVVEVLRQAREELPERLTRLNRHVHVDLRLEAICLKCLEKDPRRRYPTAGALAEDLRRWVRGEPVLARPAGLSTRVTLWCRRRPLPAVLAASLIVSAAVGVIGVGWQWLEAAHQREIAGQVDRYLRIAFLGYNDPMGFGVGRAAADERSLERAVEKLGVIFTDLPEVEAGIREAVGDTYRALGRPDKAEPQLRQALDLRKRGLWPDPLPLANAQHELASLLIVLGELDEGGRLAVAAHERLAATLGPTHLWTLRARCTRAQWFLASGKPRDAEAIYREVLATNKDRREPEATLEVVALGDLAAALQSAGQIAEAEVSYQACLKAIEASRLPDRHPLAINARNAYAGYLIRQSKWKEAEGILEEELRRNRGDENRDSIESLRVRANMAVLRYKQNRIDDAGELIARVVGGQERLLSPRNADLLNSRYLWADILTRREDWAGAASQYEVITRSRPASVLVDPVVETTEACQYGDALIELGRPKEAVSVVGWLLPKLRAGASNAGPADARKRLALALTVHGAALNAMGSFAEAARSLGEALSIRKETLNAGDWRLGNTESMLGEALAGLRQDDKAEDLLQKSYQFLSSSPNVPARWPAQARRRLEGFYEVRHRPARMAGPRESKDMSN